MRQPKSLQTLLNAITRMVDEAPLADLSITSIVNAAGVSRPTFYQHFDDVAGASRAAAIARLQQAFPTPTTEFRGETIVAEDLHSYVEGQTLPVLLHLREHQVFYAKVLHGSANFELLAEMKRFLSSRSAPQFYELVAGSKADSGDIETIISGGTIWMVIEWLNRECSEAPDLLAKRIANSVVHLLTR